MKKKILQEGLHEEIVMNMMMMRATTSRECAHTHPEACRLNERHMMEGIVAQRGSSARTARGEVQILRPLICPNTLDVHECIYTIFMHVIFVQERMTTYANVAIRLKRLQQS